MNKSLLMPDCAQPDSVDAFCQRLRVALRNLKVRLQKQYEQRLPGEGSRIRHALERAEAAAWRTPFPHLFLPDLAEEAIVRGTL